MTKFFCLFGFVFVLFFNVEKSVAQDSTLYVIYDVIHLKDGRVLKGQILSYDSQLGGISFRDKDGRVYNFRREEYSHFLEKQRFPIKAKKSIRPRKREGFEVTFGINSGITHVREKLANNDFYEDSFSGIADLPISLSGGVGKYFTSKHYAGLVGDLGVVSFEPGFFSFGAKYKYEYDSGKSNTAKYIPVELRYQQMQLSNTYQYNDTVFFGSGTGGFGLNSEYYSPVSSFSAATFSIGHGFGFITKNGGSFNIELAYLKHFILSHTFKEVDSSLPLPQSSFALQGFRLGFSLSF